MTSETTKAESIRMLDDLIWARATAIARGDSEALTAAIVEYAALDPENYSDGTTAVVQYIPDGNPNVICRAALPPHRRKDNTEAAIADAVEFIRDRGAARFEDVGRQVEQFVPIYGGYAALSGGHPIGDGAAQAPAPVDTVLIEGISSEFVDVIAGVLDCPNVVLEATECGCIDGCFGAVALTWTDRFTRGDSCAPGGVPRRSASNVCKPI